MEVAEEVSRADEIKSKVVAYIEIDGCRIGIIPPENDPDPEDLSELIHTLANVLLTQAKRKAAQK